MKHVLKYHFVTETSGQVEYDTADMESYTKALTKVNAVRKALLDTGAGLTRDDVKPARVRE